MSLRKSPTLTPALLASNRRNAKKSTGSRTAWGKAWSRLNRILDGWQWPECSNLVKAPIRCTARHRCGDGPSSACFQTGHSPLSCEEWGLSIQTDIDIWVEVRWFWGNEKEKEKEFFFATFKAGMLLKTNKSDVVGTSNWPYLYEINALILNFCEL